MHITARLKNGPFGPGRALLTGSSVRVLQTGMGHGTSKVSYFGSHGSRRGRRRGCRMVTRYVFLIIIFIGKYSAWSCGGRVALKLVVSDAFNINFGGSNLKRLRWPRPKRLHITRQPGFVACLITSLGLTVGSLLTLAIHYNKIYIHSHATISDMWNNLWFWIGSAMPAHGSVWL